LDSGGDQELFSDEDRRIERSGGGVRKEREMSKEVKLENRDSVEHFITLYFSE